MFSHSTATDDALNRPTEQELLAELGRHANGMPATALTRFFVDRGYSAYNVQRTLQRALNKGLIDLGPELQLCVAEFA